MIFPQKMQFFRNLAPWGHLKTSSNFKKNLCLISAGHGSSFGTPGVFILQFSFFHSSLPDSLECFVLPGGPVDPSYATGFRPKLSTSMVLLEMLDNLTLSIDKKEITVGVFLDLAKVFDTVNHSMILGKLYHYGIRGVTFKWFQSYLANRQQYVVVNNHKSGLTTIRCGVPQGSILGPILFLLYINDLNSHSSLRSVMFADDTNLFLSGKNLQQLELQLNEELKLVNEWFNSNLLSLNLSKTSFIIFGLGNYQDINVCINNTNINRQYSTKFLGIVLTSKLNWSLHINIVLSKASKCLGIISKVRHLIPQHLTRMLYLSLVEPYFNYCNLIWCLPNRTTRLDKIFKVQKKYCRILTFSVFSSHSKILFTQLKLFNIYYIYKFQLATYMYKIQNRLIPTLDHQAFNTGSSFHHHDTRHKNDLCKPSCRTKLHQNSFCFQGPELWNSLPDHIRAAPSLNIFKSGVKSYLLYR